MGFLSLGAVHRRRAEREFYVQEKHKDRDTEHKSALVRSCGSRYFLRVGLTTHTHITAEKKSV